MPVAFFGISGRPDAAIAALMFAWGLEKPSSLIRITLPHEASLADDRGVEEHGPVVEQHVARDASDATRIALDAIDSLGDRRAVLDLPVDLVEEWRVRDRLRLCVLACGPHPLDETAALMAHDRASRVRAPSGQRASPAWILGCGRAGGMSSARAFAADFAKAARCADIEPARLCNFVLPPIDHAHAYGLEIGLLDERVNALSKALAEALDAIVDDPRCAWARNYDLLSSDHRTPEDRLRSVADDLCAIKSGVWPDAEILGGAPILEDWSYSTSPRRVLVGTVGAGHPDLRTGRRVVTSELYASDGRTWARTLSRMYRLGAKAC